MAACGVLWFRRDLRLSDHPALEAAAEKGEVVGLFVLDPRFATAGAPRAAYLARSLEALARDMGGALVVRVGDPADVVPAVATEVGAASVAASADFGPYGRRRDAAVAQRLAEAGRSLEVHGSPYAVDPGRVLKDDGTHYRVFTPFFRAWQERGWDAPGGSVAPAWRTLRSDPLPMSPEPGCDLPPAGERAAHTRLDQFVADGLDGYADDRNRPDLAGTSRLSPYLRWGQLHPRQVLARLGVARAHQVFRSELAWREFYADVLYHRPHSAWSNLDPKMDAMPVDHGAEARRRYGQWCVGRTGYPIVDAGIRELLATGWMHNRVRMVTASFLVKDLHLPWQWGARFFLDHLVDGDLASNNHGWQWTAGTGTDAAPYFRVFNPTLQGARFDPEGAYVRRWLPELAGLSGAAVHDPSKGRAGVPLGYLAPMVDHRTERDEALRRYALVTGRAK